MDPLVRLCPSYPARPPLSGVLRRVRLSRIIALGWADRPLPSRISARRSAMIVLNTSAASQRRVCWETAGQGGRSVGMKRHWSPVRAMYRRPLNSSRRECLRWGASSRIKVRYGTRKAHSASETSAGERGRGVVTIPPSVRCPTPEVHNRL